MIEPPEEWDEDLKAEFRRNILNGAVGHMLLSETEDIRVWTIRLPPGDRIGFHRHVLDYFWVALRSGRSRSNYADGTVRETAYRAGDVRHFRFAKDESMFHDLANIGDTELEFVTVEFKRSANAPLPPDLLPAGFPA